MGPPRTLPSSLIIKDRNHFIRFAGPPSSKSPKRGYCSSTVKFQSAHSPHRLGQCGDVVVMTFAPALQSTTTPGPAPDSIRMWVCVFITAPLPLWQWLEHGWESLPFGCGVDAGDETVKIGVAATERSNFASSSWASILTRTANGRRVDRPKLSALHGGAKATSLSPR